MAGYKIDVNCDFCASSVSFDDCKQVPLRVDKNNVFQFLYGLICKTCIENNARKTLNGQTIKSTNSRNRVEETIFAKEHEEVE